MRLHKASSEAAHAQRRWSSLAATQIKSQMTVKLLFKVQLGRQGDIYLHDKSKL